MEAGRSIVVPNEELFADVTRLLDAGHRVTINCKGMSMLPVIRGGRDQVVLEKRDAYSAGDIVLFSIAGKYILHRIVSTDGKVVVTMGDGNIRGTESCRVGDIHGKVVRILRAGRRSKDPDSFGAKGFLKVWTFLLPVRRWILAVYRRLPWNRWLIAANTDGKKEINN